MHVYTYFLLWNDPLNLWINTCIFFFSSLNAACGRVFFFSLSSAFLLARRESRACVEACVREGLRLAPLQTFRFIQSETAGTAAPSTHSPGSCGSRSHRKAPFAVYRLVSSIYSLSPELVPGACPLQRDLVSWAQPHPSPAAERCKCLLLKRSEPEPQDPVKDRSPSLCSRPETAQPHEPQSCSTELKRLVFVKGFQKTGEELR